MKRLIASFIACLFFMVATQANAQSRTWVSGVGDDMNPCSRTAPCKTFAGAFSKTSAGGEINCLDPGGFGTINITKSITIDCTGTIGSILASNITGVTVNAAGIVVTLRGIIINGANTTLGNGVRIINAGAVNLDNVVIENMAGTTSTTGRGVVIDTSAANVRVNITNSHLYNLNNIGIHSNPTGGNVVLDLNHVDIARGGGTAVQIRQLTAATINDLSATNHSIGAGVGLELNTASATIGNSNLSNNAFGILVGNGGAPTARVFASMITGNTSAGLQITTGTIISSGNNIIRGNVGNEAPSSNALTQ